MEENQNSGTSGNTGKTQPNWEKSLLEKLAFASLDEQRKARRWGIVFKVFLAVYLVGIFFVAVPQGAAKKSPSGEFTALVEIEGVISSDGAASADYIVTGLRDAFASKSKAVIMRANSPGGSPVQAGYIYDEINRLKEKYPKKAVYAVVTDICASGCYYAVAGSDKIFANQASIVGSIGVLIDSFGFVESMKKLGVERRLITAGENKGMLDPFSPLNPKHKKHINSMLKEIHRQFIEVVKEGRGDALKNNKEIFSGLFWTGSKAIELGLVDELGSASYVAREVVGAEEIVDFTYRENWFDRFTSQLGAAVANTLANIVLKQNASIR